MLRFIAALVALAASFAAAMSAAAQDWPARPLTLVVAFAAPEYLQKFVESEIAKWAAPIKAAGITGE